MHVIRVCACVCCGLVGGVAAGQVYIATFWINVKQFWESGSKSMACLIFFAGVVQPTAQMASAATVAFYPLARATRHRMLTAQEVTCKVQRPVRPSI
jgi:hypothetical protein